VAEFQRDQAECTKDHVLDEMCMKHRGWIPLSPDREAPTKTTTPSHGPTY
jgi:hypothetical protein